MTQPLATAHVDAELDWDGIDDQLVRRLERSTKIATRAAQKNFDALERGARQSFDRMSASFDAQAKSMQRSFRTATTAMRTEATSTVAAIRQKFAQLGPVKVRIEFENSGLLQALRTAQTQLDARPLKARITVEAASMTAARAAMQQSLNANPLSIALTASTSQTALRAATRSLQQWLTDHPLTVSLKVDASTSLAQLQATHAAMQAWLRAHPLEVPVNPNGNNGHGGAGGGGGNGFSKFFRGIMSSAGGAIATLSKFTAIAGVATVGIAGSLPAVAALGAGLAVVGGAAGGAAIAAMSTMGVVMASLKVATAGMGEAFKNAFDPENAEKFNEAMAKLAPAAQQTVLAVKGLVTEFEKSGAKAAVQQTLFSGLGAQINGLGRLIPTVKSAMVGVAAGFNQGAKSALGFINTAQGMKSVKSILGDSSAMGATLGKSIGALVPGLLAVAQGATSAFRPFTTGVEGGAKALSDMLVKAQESGKITAWFSQAIQVAKQFGAVLAGVGSILAGVFRAAQAAGGGNGFAAITDKLSIIGDWVNSATGQNALTTFFQSMQTAVAAVLPIVTQLATIIGTTVAPAIASLLSTIGPVLQSLTPMLGSLVGSILNVVGPLIGSLVTALGPVINTIGGVLTQVFAALQPAVEPLGRLFQALGPIISQVAIALGQGLTTALGILVPIFNTVVNLLTKLAPLFFGLMEMLTPLVPLIVKVAAVAGGIFLLVKAFQMVQKVIQAVQLAWAVLSLVFSASPIGLIVVAVVALAAALWAFFTKTETGRKLWDKIWNGIKTAVAFVWDWFKTSVLPGLQTALKAIGAAALWLWQNAILPAWNGIKVAIGVVWAIVKGYFTVWMTVVKALATVVMWLWSNVISPAFQAIGQIISFAWNNVIKPIFSVFASVFQAAGAVVMWLWNNVVSPAFSAIGSLISTWWSGVQIIWSAFQTALQWVGDKVMWFWNTVIVPAFNGIKAAIETAWNGIAWVWDKFKQSLEVVGTAADVLKNAFKTAWDGIKSAVSTAWDFISGIFDKIESGMSKVGGFLKKLNPASWFSSNANGGPILGYANGGPIQAFASGGAATARRAMAKVSGAGGPRADRILSWLSNGEYVEPARAVTSKTLPWLEAIRRGWQPPEGLTPRAYAAGGPVNGREPYGLPVGTNTGGYGSSGSIFPAWVHDIEKRFGVKASTYPGHQEKDGKNKGIDWSGSVPNMQRFAEYLRSIKGELEQVIWMNPETGEKIGVADGKMVGPGTDQPGYYAADWADHANHVHTRQSYSFGGSATTGPGIDSLGGTSTGGDLTSTSTGGSSTPIGSGIGSSSSGGGSASWGNSGGGSRFNSVGQARKGGLTPVWVENWPASIGGGGGGSSSPMTPTSDTTGGDLTPTSGTSTTGGKDLRKGASKAEMVAEVVRIGRAKGMSDADIESAVAVMLAESDGKNYANSNVAGSTDRPHDAVGSDGKSLGVMQQQSGMGWGKDEDLMNPTYAIGTYYDRLAKLQGRDSMSVAQRSQAIQRSAFSDGSNYSAKQDEARKLIKAAGQQQTPAPTTTSPLTPAGDSTGGTTSQSTMTGLTNTVAKLKRDIETAKGDVRAKEQRRDEVKADPKSKASQITAAENALTKAQNRVTTLEERLTKADQKVNEAQSKPKTDGQGDTTVEVEYTIGGSALSGQAGGFANTATKTGLDGWLKDNPGMLGDFDNTKAKTSLGTRAGGVADSFLSGQLSSALGIFGLDAQPPVLDAIGQYMTDNKSDSTSGEQQQKNLIDLVKAAFEAGSVVVNMQGGNGQEVANKIDAARRRKMRRYVK